MPCGSDNETFYNFFGINDKDVIFRLPRNYRRWTYVDFVTHTLRLSFVAVRLFIRLFCRKSANSTNWILTDTHLSRALEFRTRCSTTRRNNEIKKKKMLEKNYDTHEYYMKSFTVLFYETTTSSEHTARAPVAARPIFTYFYTARKRRPKRVVRARTTASGKIRENIKGLKI